MADKEIKCLIEGGKATPAPPLGPALGPTGVNIGMVISKLNQETSKFAGMKVPVTIIVHQDRTFDLQVGIPTTAGLILKEAGLKIGGKGSTEEKPEAPFVGNITLQQVFKIADMKRSGSLASNYKMLCKEILGTMVSCKVSCEGKNPRDVQKEIDQGVHDNLFSGKNWNSDTTQTFIFPYFFSYHCWAIVVQYEPKKRWTFLFKGQIHKIWLKKGNKFQNQQSFQFETI